MNPSRALNLSDGQYNQLIPQGRSSHLLGTLAVSLEQAGSLDQVQAPVRRHLQSAMVVHDKQKQDLAYEIKWLRKALSTAGEKLVLLKGAAYLQAGLRVGRGRLLSDIDILVPAHQMSTVESVLNEHGWESGELDPYNARYYRKWMHEIPPMSHKKRRSTLDLHHTILPPTAAPNVDANLLFDELVEVRPDVFTLSPRDMVIHSATHLFHEGEFHHGLRDLWDLNRMLRDFPARDSSFWESLVPRAQQLQLLDPLYYGLTYTRHFFKTPVPAAVMEQASNPLRALRKPFMDFLFHRAFMPSQPECKLPFTQFAESILYVRSHYLRMPIYLLIPHLVRKSWMSHFGPKNDTEEKTTDAE